MLVSILGLDERRTLKTNAPCSWYLDNFGVTADDVSGAFARSKELFALGDEA
jgi:hypothetical protein